jgi:hypothetical protein
VVPFDLCLSRALLQNCIRLSDCNTCGLSLKMLISILKQHDDIVDIVTTSA